MFSNECLHFLSISTRELELPDQVVLCISIFCGTSALFSSGRTSSHLLQQRTGLPFSPHPCQHLLSVVFLMVAILTGWPTVVLISVSWMMSDVEQLFMCLLAIICLFEKNAYLGLLSIF